MQSAMLGGGGPLRQLWRAYERQLQKRPVPIQMTTSFLLWGMGDVIAQRMEQHGASFAGGSPPPGVPSHHTRSLPEESERALREQARLAQASEITPPLAAATAAAAEAGTALDARRILMTALFGAVLVGPVGHFWYLGLDKWCARRFVPNSARFITAKVAIDTLTMGPFYVAAFFAWGAAFIETDGLAKLPGKLQRDFLPTLAAECCFWPGVQTLNFTKVPLQHQLLVVNTMTIADAAFMSWARNQDDWLGKALHWLQRPQHQDR